MSLFQAKRALPFHDSSALFLSWITMLMVFVATLALLGALSINNVIAIWQRGVSGALTIQVPTYLPNGEARGDAVQQDIAKTSEILDATRGVISYSVVSDDKMSDLLSPWIDDSKAIPELPLPKLLDVQINADVFDFFTLKDQLAKVAPLVQADAHRITLMHLIETGRRIQQMLSFILLLLILTTAFTVVYTSSSTLAVHQPTIHILHMMGAKDSSIAAQYASRDFMRALMGGVIGLLLAIPLGWLCSRMLMPEQLPLLQGASLSWTAWSVILCLPLGIALLAFITALLTVLKILRRAI
ncbi:MAG: FtsX-like permease family protein [Alphaproteobacteria bacterium]|nr:FtsX-like permease family protein [Alphaproteobacteria bacterium]